MFFAASGETLAKRFIGWWTYEQWLPQRTQIETCTADEQWHATAAFDLFDLLCSFARPFAGRVVDVWRDEIDQVMRNAFAFVEWHFSGGDLDLVIDLDGVAVDDL